MSTMRPEDVAAMFDLPPLDEPAAPAGPTLEEAEAALAAELAASMDGDGVADDAPDSRTKRRIEVSWPARLRLPGGRAIALKVRNISEHGVGLVGEEEMPARTVVDFEVDVPAQQSGGAATPVAGRIRTTYTVARGSEFLCGASWVDQPAAALGPIHAWILRLRD